MQTNNHKIVDYDAVLDTKFGKEKTPERARVEETVHSFYSIQILQNDRKEAKITQTELAELTQTTKSYISKIENGIITPSVRVPSYHFCAWNEGRSGEASELSIQFISHN